MATKIRRGALSKLALLDPQAAQFGARFTIARDGEPRFPMVPKPKPEAERTHFSVHRPLIERRVRSFVNRRRNK